MINKNRLQRERRNAKMLDFDGLKNELDAGSDRNTVILCGALLEAHIDELLRTTLIDDENEVEELIKPVGPLGSFGAKIRTLYCLGILSKSEFHNLKLIAKIRNKFAHELHGLSFETPEITDLCARLGVSLNPPRNRESSSENHFLLVVISFQIGLPLRLELITKANVRPESTWEDDMDELSKRLNGGDDL